MFSLRQEFPTQWNRFLNPANSMNGNIFDLEISPSFFPIRDVGKTLKVNMITLLARCTDAGRTRCSSRPKRPAHRAFLALNRVNEYGGLHFAARDTFR